MRWRAWACVAALCLAIQSGCESFPPALTGLTIYPSDARGQPRDDALWRTRLGPPIPAIAVKPGADAEESAQFLNEPGGSVAVTLARGAQNFVLYAAAQEEAVHFVIVLWLDHEALPALAGVVTDDPEAPLAASTAGTVLGLDGEAVPNPASLSVVRGGYRVSLRRAAFPLHVGAIDVVGPWSFQPDRVADAVGLITLDVEPASDAARG